MSNPNVPNSKAVTFELTPEQLTNLAKQLGEMTAPQITRAPGDMPLVPDPAMTAALELVKGQNRGGDQS